MGFQLWHGVWQLPSADSSLHLPALSLPLRKGNEQGLNAVHEGICGMENLSILDSKHFFLFF